jgi:hypothetical protein
MRLAFCRISSCMAFISDGFETNFEIGNPYFLPKKFILFVYFFLDQQLNLVQNHFSVSSEDLVILNSSTRFAPISFISVLVRHNKVVGSRNVVV